MLKLERVSHDSQIAIFVRDKEHLFNRSFLLALSAAVGFHALIFLLFHISPIKIRWNSTTASPAIVEADLSPGINSMVTASADTALRQRSNLLEPKPPMPILQNTPAFSTVRQMEYVKEKNYSINPFAQIEKEVYQPSFSSSVRQKAPLPPVSLVISGPLATRPIVNDGINNISLPSLPSKQKDERRLRAVYAVLVEGGSGKVFWYEKKEKLSLTALETTGEHILRDLRFSPDPTSQVMAGEIELHFTLENYD